LFTDKRVHLIEYFTALMTNCSVRHLENSAPKDSQFEKLPGMMEGVKEVEKRTAEALAELQHGRNIGEERGEKEGLYPLMSPSAAATLHGTRGTVEHAKPSKIPTMVAPPQGSPLDVGTLSAHQSHHR
jgi:hypothetical protein